jgi:hypothetical protein
MDDGRPAHPAGRGRPASTTGMKLMIATDYFFAALTFAHRAFCARRIAARPLALMGRRFLLSAGAGLLPRLLYTPANAARAAFNPDNCCCTRSRSFFN